MAPVRRTCRDCGAQYFKVARGQFTCATCAELDELAAGEFYEELPFGGETVEADIEEYAPRGATGFDAVGVDGKRVAY